MELSPGSLTTCQTSSPVPTQALVSSSPARNSDLIDAAHPRRQQVEQFIARRFLKVHGARISSFMPLLITLFDENDEVRAAVGVRSASTETLFLEYYLDTSIEQAISGNTSQPLAPPSRDRIIEIGNLASIDRNASRRLFQMLSGILLAENFEWAVFTGCTSLQRMFATLGIETVDLGFALQSRLPVEQQTWGGYYEDSPRVVAGKVSRGCLAFDNMSSSRVAA